MDSTLAVPGHAGVWALGDCAALTDAKTGAPCPPTAQFALREAAVLAGNIRAELMGRPRQAFHFDSLGALCVVGHQTACAELTVPFTNGKTLQFSGLLAWLMWRGIYLAKLPGLERKIRVLIDWTIDLFFPRDIVQTIDCRGSDSMWTSVLIGCRRDWGEVWRLLPLWGSHHCMDRAWEPCSELRSAVFCAASEQPRRRLIWGLSYAFLAWITLPAGILPLMTGVGRASAMLQDARDRFPELEPCSICLGLPVGLALGIRGGVRRQRVEAKFSWGRALVSGGVAGTLGGLIFSRWMYVGNFFRFCPASASSVPGRRQSYSISALRFSSERLSGCCFSRTFAVMAPRWDGALAMRSSGGFRTVDDSSAALADRLWTGGRQGSQLFGSLVGHILYGLILGVLYAVVDQLWVRLLLNRTL